VWDHSLVGALYKKYPNSCHIPTVPFLNVGDVVGVQRELIIYGTSCGRPITCWSIAQEIQSKLIIYGTACARPFTCQSILQEIPQFLSYFNNTISM
jgi:hypothetical protein